MYSSYVFFTSALHASECTIVAVLNTEERIPETHWVGGGVGLRPGLDTEARLKTLCSARDQTSVIWSVVSHYTD
jgi:hypothetical protein